MANRRRGGGNKIKRREELEETKAMTTEYEEMFETLKTITTQTDDLTAEIRDGQRNQDKGEGDYRKEMACLETSLMKLKVRYEVTNKDLEEISTRTDKIQERV